MSASLAVGRQFMRGRDVLVTPVLTPNVSSYSGESTAFLVWARSHSKTQPPFFTAYVPQTAFLPSRRRVIWCDWYPNNHESEELVSCRWKRKEKKKNTVNVDHDAPLGHVHLLMRSGAAPLALAFAFGLLNPHERRSTICPVHFLSHEGSAEGTPSSMMAIRRECWCTTYTTNIRRFFFRDCLRCHPVSERYPPTKFPGCAPIDGVDVLSRKQMGL